MAKTILVADDSKTIQQVVAMTFEKTDYTVVTASSAREAIQMALSGPVVVLADVLMPDSDGYSLCTTLKQQATTGHIPVLLLTRAAEPVDEMKAQLARADGHIKKPFDSGDLIDLVKQVTGAPVETDLPKSFAASLSRRASEGVLTPRAAPTPEPPPAVAAPAMAASPFSAPLAEPPLDLPMTSDDLAIDDDLLIEEIEIEDSDDMLAMAGPTLEPPTPPTPVQDRAPVDMWALADGSTQNEGPQTVEIEEEAVQPILLEDAVEIISEPHEVAPEADVITRDIHQADPTRDMGSVPGALAEAAAPAIADAVAPMVPAGLSKEELIAVARTVIEQIAWEVVPDLAETIIREELARLTKD